MGVEVEGGLDIEVGADVTMGVRALMRGIDVVGAGFTGWAHEVSRPQVNNKEDRKVWVFISHHLTYFFLLPSGFPSSAIFVRLVLNMNSW